MDRLTEYTVDSFGIKRICLKRPTKKSICSDCKSDCDMCSFKLAVDKLAAYEDTALEPEGVIHLAECWQQEHEALCQYLTIGSVDHLRELVQAERDGRLAVLPCKAGDTVYAAETSPVIPLSVAYVGVYLDGADGGDWEALDNIGKTVFLTREEAEAALKGGADNE